MSERLVAARGVLLDMDGTFYLGERLLPGALRFIEVLQAQGRAHLFLTNNSSRSRNHYAAKLRRLGLPVEEDRILTSGEATARHLARVYPEARIFLAGTPALEEEFRVHGLTLDPEQPDLVVLGFDTTLTYERLWRLCDLVRAGLPFIATHADFNCPTEGGWMPDVGSMLALVRASTGREPDLVVGKPNRLIVEAAAAKLGLPIETLAMIGDRLYTDIALGRTAGIATVLVLSGETGAADLAASDERPDAVFDDLGAVADWLAAQPRPTQPRSTQPRPTARR